MPILGSDDRRRRVPADHAERTGRIVGIEEQADRQVVGLTVGIDLDDDLLFTLGQEQVLDRPRPPGHRRADHRLAAPAGEPGEERRRRHGVAVAPRPHLAEVVESVLVVVGHRSGGYGAAPVRAPPTSLRSRSSSKATTPRSTWSTTPVSCHPIAP